MSFKRGSTVVANMNSAVFIHKSKLKDPGKGGGEGEEGERGRGRRGGGEEEGEEGERERMDFSIMFLHASPSQRNSWLCLSLSEGCPCFGSGARPWPPRALGVGDSQRATLKTAY